MQIIAQCPFCKSSWLFGKEYADKRVRCKNCGQLFKIPTLEEVPKAAKVIRDAKGTIYVDQNGNTYG